MPVAAVQEKSAMETYFPVLISISLAHFLVDLMTAVVPALLPVLQKELTLNYIQLGTIVMISSTTASLFQPFLGFAVDKRPLPWLLPFAAILSGLGLAGIGGADSYSTVLMAAFLIGMGSALFHPEGSRVTHLAAGRRRGLSQSIFQVGGNAGQAIGPLMIPLLFIPFGLSGSYWLLLVAGFAAVVLLGVARWSVGADAPGRQKAVESGGAVQRAALAWLVVVVTMRSWLHSGIASFLPLYYVNELNQTIASSEIRLFLFLFAGAIGTFFGGVAGDRFGKRNVLLFSMWGSIPFLLLLPYLDGFLSYANVFILGFISLSSFAVSVVYAQQLYPGRIGMVSGLMIGFAIGMGGIGAAVLGGLADWIGLAPVLMSLGILPVIGSLIAYRLPADRQ
jgi:FSR family fosmidomycin resistance protein-like MFS transporter